MSDAPKYVVLNMRGAEIISVHFVQSKDPMTIVNFMEYMFSDSESYYRINDPDEYEIIYEFHARDEESEDEDHDHVVLAFVAKDQSARLFYFNKKNKKDDLYFVELPRIITESYYGASAINDPPYIRTSLIDLDK